MTRLIGVFLALLALSEYVGWTNILPDNSFLLIGVAISAMACLAYSPATNWSSYKR